MQRTRRTIRRIHKVEKACRLLWRSKCRLSKLGDYQKCPSWLKREKHQTGCQQVAIQITVANKPAMESHKPAMAIPLPVCIPAECLICDKATPAKIIPATQVTGPQQQVIQPIAPKTKLVIAKPFVRVGTETRSGGFSMTGGAKSSGNSTSGFQSGLPTGCTKVCAVARPSAIHWRNCSSVTGPYILPSVPISL